MATHKKLSSSIDQKEDDSAAFVWAGADYSRVPAGRYSAVAVRVLGPDWLRNFRRWSIAIEFELLGEEGLICAFFNLGCDRDKPKIGRGSRYFQAWTLANGGVPRKGQVMSPQVFLDSQVFIVEVADSGTDSDGRRKLDAEIYSRVTSVIRVDSSNRMGECYCIASLVAPIPRF